MLNFFFFFANVSEKNISEQSIQEFFWVGKVSWNKPTLIIIPSTAYEENIPQGKILKCFLLDILKKTF